MEFDAEAATAGEVAAGEAAAGSAQVALSAEADAAGVAVEAEAPPAAAVISSGVASSTRRFWEKMQPAVSSAVSPGTGQ